MQIKETVKNALIIALFITSVFFASLCTVFYLRRNIPDNSAGTGTTRSDTTEPGPDDNRIIELANQSTSDSERACKLVSDAGVNYERVKAIIDAIRNRNTAATESEE